MLQMFSRFCSLALLGLLALGVGNAHAAKWFSDYNHPDLDWYTIEGEHFIVHYQVSKRSVAEGNDHYMTGEWSARQSAQVADEMWPKMCAEFNYYLKEKVHIVLLNDPDDLTGFTIPNWDWIVISANPGGTFYRGRGRMEWFSDVLVHEFAHVVSLKANGTMSEGAGFGTSIGGLYRDGINNADTGVSFQIVDGDSVFWTEGGAEYWSDNTGYNWWTSSRDQNIRMTVLQDRLLEYDEWHTRSGKSGSGWGDHERYYQQGYSFGQYLRQRFGNQTYAKFALEYGKKWRPAWESVIEDVVGVDAETLYWDWRAYITERYEAQYDAVRARGEVVGKEMLGKNPEWMFANPEKRDDWFERERWDREKTREKSGTYQWEPRISPDGKYWSILNRANIMVHRADGDQVFEWTGHAPIDPVRNEKSMRLSTHFSADFEHGYDFVPGKDAIVLTGREDMMPSMANLITGVRLETDGYDWKQLWYFDMPTRQKEEGNRTVTTRERKQLIKGVLKQEVFEKGSFHKIPNTQRGQDPAVSPDGKRVAYFEYTDGTFNLVTINLDGSEKKHLTSFADGTWMQKVDWSPDGKQLVFSIFRHYQQNLVVINADGTGIRPITWDQWEELDAHWAADGKIYFSADPDGIFNIYSYDPEKGGFKQITNVIGGGSTPQISPDGHLLYTYYESFGWKVYGLPADQFMNTEATHFFNQTVSEETFQEALTYSEDLTHWADTTTKYNAFKSLLHPVAIPIFEIGNDSRTNWDVQGGAQILAMDAVQEHMFIMDAMLGEEILFLPRWFYNGWYIDIGLIALHWRDKFDDGIMIDQDQDPTTTDDQQVFDSRRQIQQNQVMSFLSYPWNSNFSTSFMLMAFDYGIKTESDSTFLPYMNSVEGSLGLMFSNNSYFMYSANPYRGRTITLDLNHGWTDIVYEAYSGRSIDDGEILDAYAYNKGEFRWVEQVPMPTFGGIPFLKNARKNRHTIQVDLDIGLVDRNVDGNDEYHGGGKHPYYTGYGTIRPNTQFAGYPYYSLSGETMGVLGLAYRFPINQHIRKKMGPLFTHGIYGQLGGTAGNLWSYRPPTSESKYYKGRYGERIAYDSTDIKREIPFVDKAYKNGNYMLYDLQAELRVENTMFHGANWNSFARVAYGFQEVRGYGDVDGDDIYDTSDNALGDELSNETEKPGLRFYIGLGTGW